jgi:hypothetical protein
MVKQALYTILCCVVWAVVSCSDPIQGTFHEGAGVEVTIEGAGKLVASPTSVDFLVVCPGGETVREIQLENTGEQTVTLTDLRLDETSSSDYSVLAIEDVLGELLPGEAMIAHIQYAPTQGNQDNGNLLVSYAHGRLLTIPLSGREGGPSVSVFPEAIDFGPVAVGEARTETLSLSSVGDSSISLVSLTFAFDTEDAGFSWQSSELPALPFAVEPGNEVTLSVQLAPERFIPSVDTPIATLEIQSNDCLDDVREIPLHGWPGGVDISCPFDLPLLEDFEGRSPADTDVLFVVDNSDSMADEQEELATNFNAFIETANALKVDYQIGVITTDMNSNGELHRIPGEPKIVTPGTSDLFAEIIKVGTVGSNEEQGLAAAAAALSDPGSFGGYLREDAILIVVFVSDEDDHSPPGDYLSLFEALKAGSSEGSALFYAHAIVGPSGGCATANPGLKYIDIAEQSGGVYANICEASFGGGLFDIGDLSFGYNVNFLLSQAAYPGTVTVKVNGESCESGWQLSADGWRVRFDPEAGCLPVEGDDLQISYDPICMVESTVP